MTVTPLVRTLLVCVPLYWMGQALVLTAWFGGREVAGIAWPAGMLLMLPLGVLMTALLLVSGSRTAARPQPGGAFPAVSEEP